MEQQLLDACTHCGFCLPTCPTYGVLWQQEADSPRGRIHLMQGLLDGTVSLNEVTVSHFDRCLGCMACVTACPSGVRYDRLIEQTRAHVEERFERGSEDWLLRALTFSILPHPRRMRALLPLARLGSHLPLPGALRPFSELAPSWRSSERAPERTPAAGPRRMRVGLLTGCVQRTLFGDVNAATARVLAADGCEVIAPRGQRCCGALHLHAGRREEGHARAERLERVFLEQGVEALVVNSAGCGSHLKEAGLDLPVCDVSELVVELASGVARSPLPIRVAFQDSCHLAHAQRIREAPRALLRRIPELVLLEPAEQEICCGSAGIYNLVQPEAARELGDRKAERVLATGAEVYVSANPGCLVQVAAALRRSGRPLPALHPIELVDASLAGVQPASLLAAARG
ncbi:MAG: glycolate oxidase [Candidatus Rokuibacteriota bacterium]|nr:MAG: glycolate oxidase [Candidatus Rokubacteria bacterium]